MSKPTILFAETEPWEAAYLKKRLKDFHLQVHQEKLEDVPPPQPASVTVLSPFIYSEVNVRALKRFPKLELVVTRSMGFDHVDLAATHQAGVTVSNVPIYGENTVAEHTIALLLAISRKLPESFERTRRGSFKLDGLRGFDLRGLTLGIVGVGSIGSHVARMARAFEMKVIGYQRHPNEELAQKLGFRYVPLTELLKTTDIISLHIPENDETHHFLSTKEFSQMKDGVIILNTARGGLIDTKTLVTALDSGKVSWAGLDVLEEEGLVREERQLLTKQYQPPQLTRALEGHILLSHPRVLMTPHNAFNSKEALERILKTTIANIKSFYAGQPANIVE